MLTVLGGLAEFERELIRARIGEGRARAKAWRENGASVPNDAATPHQIKEGYSAATLESRYVTSPDRMMSATAQF